MANGSIYTTSPPEGQNHTLQEGEGGPPTLPLASRATSAILAPPGGRVRGEGHITLILPRAN
ncbi:hypothetical protein E2C01_095194 [Portunus trituberculatus]|uniref:Uncharacterized protein n=1 Tax=Portunus trituberculatus TaxID=210409 RepID=A0A5B7JY53_PORTR|nr:hypothetical protein [Portunus trituberculatus]